METNFSDLLTIYQANVFDGPLEDFAVELGVTKDALNKLGIGYAPILKFGSYENDDGWWVFPERDQNGKVIGLSARNVKTGDKRQVEGSRRGLTYVFSGIKGGNASTEKPTESHNWVRVHDVKLRCPKCNRGDGCLLSKDNPADPSAVICIRVEQGAKKKVGLGWLHILKQGEYVKTKQAIESPLASPHGNEPVYVVEGASDCASGLSIGTVTVGRPSASGGFDLLKGLLKGRRVVVIGENGDTKDIGKRSARDLARELQPHARSAIVIMPPEQYKDLRKWRNETDLTKEGLETYVESNKELVRASGRSGNKDGGAGDTLSSLVEAEWGFFRAREGVFARIPRGSAWDCVLIDGEEFRGAVSNFALREADLYLPPERIKEIVARIKATDGLPDESINVRIGYSGPTTSGNVNVGDDSAIWYDICDPERRFIKITKTGWQVTENAACPLKFLRTPGMKPLIVPGEGDMEGGKPDLEPLFGMLRPADRLQGTMIAAWLLGCFLPAGPIPILAITGAAGTGKTMACSMIRSLIDPCDCLIDRPPRTEALLFSQAVQASMLAFDNLSFIDNNLADALCSLVSGTGLKLRKLYTTNEMVTLSRRVSILLNGIPSEIFERGDLRERVRVVQLRPFGDTGERKSETEVWREFENIRPLALATILNGVVGSLRTST